MKNLNAYIVKFGLLSQQAEDRLGVKIYTAILQNFTLKEQEDFMIQDEENRTLIVFIPEIYKYKIDNFVNEIKKTEPIVIELYEDVTNKFLYDNNFSDYNVKKKLIVNFIKSNLNTNDILDKIIKLGGVDKLTETDIKILQETV